MAEGLALALDWTVELAVLLTREVLVMTVLEEAAVLLLALLEEAGALAYSLAP